MVAFRNEDISIERLPHPVERLYMTIIDHDIPAFITILRDVPDVNTTYRGNFLLYHVVSYGTPEMIILLLQAGADINKTGYFGTAILHAIRNGFISMTRVLLDNGALLTGDDIYFLEAEIAIDWEEYGYREEELDSLLVIQENQRRIKTLLEERGLM